MAYILLIICLVCILAPFKVQLREFALDCLKVLRYLSALIFPLLLLILIGPLRLLNLAILLLPLWLRGRPQWRQHQHYQQHKEESRQHQQHFHHAPRPESSSDAISEALEILELSPTATQEEIEAAYKTMLKKHHPDKGGSKYFTRKIINAKKILINRNKGK